MKNIFQFDSISSYLKALLKDRISRNPNYSLRAFARDTGVSSSRLSELMSGKGNPTRNSIAKIAAGLQLSESEKDFLIHLNIAINTKNPKLKLESEVILNKYKSMRIQNVVHSEKQTLLDRWYYLPLIELLTVKKQINSDEIKKALDLNEKELSSAIECLKNMGHISIDKNGTIKKTYPFLKLESPVPSESIKNFHRAIIKRSYKGLTQPIKQRKYLSSVFAVKKQSIADARKEIEAFNRNFIEKYSATEGAEDIYCFSMQLFEFADRGES